VGTVRRVLVARLDNIGDVLLAGPAVRAVAAGADVTFLAGPRGAEAARLLPGVGEVLVFDAPWEGDDAPPASEAAVACLVQALRARRFDEALVLTSPHQSPLPLALLLRLAGISFVGATSQDGSGSLLDVRLRHRSDRHEVEQSLELAAACGHRLPPTDDASLAVRRPAPLRPVRSPAAAPRHGRYVVVHPGASVPARRLPGPLAAGAVDALATAGWRVVVTGSQGEAELTSSTAGPRGVDLGGRSDLAGLVDVVAGADAVVCGNTGIAHVAAAVGTPVVEVFAPVVPPERWCPWGVRHELLGHLDIGCGGCRSRRCPLADQPCTSGVTAGDVVAAVHRLAGDAHEERSA
jgi:ADP-heptose:LPS heptosyltransferase